MITLNLQLYLVFLDQLNNLTLNFDTSFVHDQYKYIATDKKGLVYLYETYPMVNDDLEIWQTDSHYTFFCDVNNLFNLTGFTGSRKIEIVNWKNTCIELNNKEQ